MSRACGLAYDEALTFDDLVTAAEKMRAERDKLREESKRITAIILKMFRQHTPDYTYAGNNPSSLTIVANVMEEKIEALKAELESARLEIESMVSEAHEQDALNNL